MAILQALADALNGSQFESRDAATIAIAVRLAQEIDAASELRAIGDLSTRLLNVLNALGLTPLSRIAITKGVAANVAIPNAQTAVDELRARRARTDGS